MKCLRCGSEKETEVRNVTALDIKMSGLLNQPPMTMQQGFPLPLCASCLLTYVEACLRNGPMSSKAMLGFLGFKDEKPANVVMLPGVK
jgi:hypothetical protein